MLLVTASVQADYVGLVAESQVVDQSNWVDSDPRSLIQLSVYAEFYDPGDILVSVYGSSPASLVIETSDPSGFWQFDADGTASPDDYNTSQGIHEGLDAIFPSQRSDSFVTIGLINSTGNNLGDIGLDFGSFNNEDGMLFVDNGTWFITPDDPQGQAGNYPGYRVLIAKLTAEIGSIVSGTVNIQVIDSSDGSYTQVEGVNFTVHLGNDPDPDCNINGVPDEEDIANGTSFDCDGDLVPDECEYDCDGDGIIDDCDSEPDQDGNGVPDHCDPDCNDNGIADGVEIIFDWADDCDGDSVPDDCQLADGSATDCDFDGTLDHCQITDDPDLDCDENGVLDSCEVGPVLTQSAKLTADDGASSDHFGYSVATSRGIAVIGATRDDDNGISSGSAYVYEQQGDDTWQQTAKLTADDGAYGDHFGSSIALNAGVAVIGAPYDDDNDPSSGSAYVYEQQGDGTWQQVAKLTANDGAIDERFGISVATSDRIAVIGAVDYPSGGLGSAYVFEQQADSTWLQTAKLTANDGASGNYFGYSVATSGGVAVIGALGDDDNGSSSGSAYVYEPQGDGTWPQTAKLTPDDGAEWDYFGGSVAIDSGVAVIGALGDDSGSAYVFEQQGDGTWQQVAKLTADDGAEGDQFGYSVATSGGVVVIGAAYDDDNGTSSGSAYVYEQQGDGTWQQVAKLTGAYGDLFGYSVAIDSGVAVIGALLDDDNGTESGSAYVFEIFSQADCDANGLMDDCEIEEEPSLDCDLDGILDICAVADGSVDDCNENGIPDSCDIADGGDADGDGYLDECECDADIAGPDGPGFPDGIVSTDDLLTVIGYWGSAQPNGDVNGDGIVGTDDLLAVISAWGPCE